MAEGVNDNDAVNLKQVNSLLKNLAPQPEQPTLQAETRASGLTRASSSLPPEQLIVAGPTTKQNTIPADHEDSMAIGVASQATADNTLAAGSNVSATARGAVGVGQNVAVDGTYAVALGSNSSAGGAGSVSIGANSTADGERSIAIGRFVSVGVGGGGDDTVVIGNNIDNIKAKNSIVPDLVAKRWKTM